MPDKAAKKAPSAKRGRVRKVETVRERKEKAQTHTDKPRRLRQATGKVSGPFKSLATVGRKEFYLPLPDNRLGRFLNKRRSAVPKFFKEAWQELKLVSWPSRQETWKLTLAVFIFAIAFSLIVAVTDYGLENLLRKVIL